MFTTVTLNPALDKLLETDALHFGESNRTRLLSASAAGKGIDVAKVLRDLQCEVDATGFLGGDVADIFYRCFEKEQIGNRFVPIADTTRTNIQLFEKNGRRTGLLEAGPEISAAECTALAERMKELCRESAVVTICGSVPKGVSSDFFSRLIRNARAQCEYVIVDTSGPWLRLAIDEQPDLIKPNRDEMRELMGNDQADDQEMAAFAQQLVKKGLSYVIVSLGGDGAMLISAAGMWRSKAPDIEVKSTVGCGDTMVASLSVSLSERRPPDDMLRRAVALSAANAMTFETAHVILDDYHRLLSGTTVEKLG